MKNTSSFKKLILTGLIIFLSLGCASAQGKIYTRKMRLADFPTKTTKIVVGNSSFFEISLREEITARWRISPYEFSSPEEYESLKQDSNYYILSLGEKNGISYIVIEKGGKANDVDNLKNPFEVIRFPFSSAGSPNGSELIYMGAFIDIIQAYIEGAMVSDKLAYSGLGVYDKPRLKGKTVYVNSEECDRVFLDAANDAVVGLVVAPNEIENGYLCYKMLIATDSHELLYYKEHKFKKEEDRIFSDREIKMFERKHGIIVR